MFHRGVLRVPVSPEREGDSFPYWRPLQVDDVKLIVSTVNKTRGRVLKLLQLFEKIGVHRRRERCSSSSLKGSKIVRVIDEA